MLETEIYKRRFAGDNKLRHKMFNVLCTDFFQKYIKESDVVLDLASAYCEFINNIKAGSKIAVDINPDIISYAKEDVDVIISSSTDLSQINEKSIDVVFISNFFEHISKENIVKTLKEVYRVLKNDGKILLLFPNIRYCYKNYWMFFDHITPLDDKSLIEVLEINNFKIVQSIPKFIPYSLKSKLPNSVILLKIYLKMPIFWKIFGKQAFIYGVKD
jgi:ubiquinone/menaquinone biosynthesis C-methylase UbiE